MRIGINALFRFKPTGVANYICNLVYHLSEVDRKNEYFIITAEENKQYLNIEQSNFKHIYCKLFLESPAYRRVWEQIVLPGLIGAHNIDLLHCPMNILPLFADCAKVVTLIDTQYFQNPDHFSFLRRNYLKHMMRMSLSKANGVITISEAVKEEVRKCLQNGDHRDVKVIHFGLDPCFRVIDDLDKIEGVKQKYGIKGKYMLFPGYPHYRKNIPRLIAAFKEVVDVLAEPLTFVIAGEMGTDDTDVEAIHHAIDTHALHSRVLFAGYVPGICLRGGEEELSMALLMNGAELMVYPSLYEGFGLPVLEAMACGTPALVSDIPVMREVAGDAAVFVNPYDVSDIARGLREGLTDAALRAEVTRKGLERSKDFRWVTHAEQTLDYYELVFRNAERN